MLPMPHPSTRALRNTSALVLASVCALGAAGCNGAFLGNFVVLGLTLGVFFGTLGLGRARPAAPNPRSAETSHSEV
ncbi:MAG: hypothetical protein ACK6CU_21280 [Deltaproteobacteria bacterium]|jgi:hypothetical protein